jgi:prepilin signal peptidase PulO-like enzyme (type II secretory pathway)
MFYFFLVFIFLFGLIIGSFLNCLIWRLHTGEGIGGRSYCPKCKKQIEWYDNIPLLSFIILKGKCRHCGKRISWQYPAVEFLTGVLFVLAYYYNFQFEILNLNLISNFKFQILNLFKYWFLIAVMIVVFVYDLRWYLILDIVTLPACAVVILINLLLGMNWQNMAISGIIGGSFFLLQFLISNGKWIGGGDIRLGLLMGLALGWPDILIALSLAYFIGAFFSIILIISGKKKWGSKIPLGIFLSTGTVITLFWGEKMMDWYFHNILFL